MNKIGHISLPLCLFLVSLSPSRFYSEPLMRVAKPLLVTMNFHSPPLAAFYDNNMKLTYPLGTHRSLGKTTSVDIHSPKAKVIQLQAGEAPLYLARFSQDKKKINKVALSSPLKLKKSPPILKQPSSTLQVQLKGKLRIKLKGLTLSLETLQATHKTFQFKGESDPSLPRFRQEPPLTRVAEVQPAGRRSSSDSSLVESLDMGHLGISSDVKELDAYPREEWLDRKLRRGSVARSHSKVGGVSEFEEQSSSQESLPRVLVQRSSLGNPIYIKSHQGEDLSVRERAKDKDVATQDSQVTLSKDKDVKKSRYELSGSLELTGGLAFTGVDTHLSITRIVNNRIIDEGDLILDEGVYKISVSDLRGHIVARLYNADGTLGSGEFDLYKLPKKARASNQIDRLHIKIKPYNPAAIASVPSGESFDGYQIPSKGSLLTFNAIQKEVQAEVESDFL